MRCRTSERPEFQGQDHGLRGSPLALLLNPVRLAIQNSFWWLLFFLVVAGAGIFVQIRASRAYEVEAYNRYGEW